MWIRFNLLPEGAGQPGGQSEGGEPEAEVREPGARPVHSQPHGRLTGRAADLHPDLGHLPVKVGCFRIQFIHFME